jgi:hypothetical protein
LDQHGDAADTGREQERAMPQFVFHIRDFRQGLTRDELGLDFPDAETAYLEAFQAGLDLRREFVARGQSPRDYSIVIANSAHELVSELPFSDVFRDRMTKEPAHL